MPNEQSKQVMNNSDSKGNNLISVVSNFADENLKILRNISTGLAILGIIVIGRSIKLITKFNAVSEIPQRFIERNVSLRGRLHRISEKGLEVEHVPIYVPVLSPLFVKCQTGAVLQVHLAGVDLSPEGWDWLRGQLKPQDTVWFKLLSNQGDHLHCWVSGGRGYPFSVAFNEQLLRHGLARSAPIVGLDHRSRAYWRFHGRLLRAERWAERKGRGLWREPSVWERATIALRENSVLQRLKRLLFFLSRPKRQ